MEADGGLSPLLGIGRRRQVEAVAEAQSELLWFEPQQENNAVSNRAVESDLDKHRGKVEWVQTLVFSLT